MGNAAGKKGPSSTAVVEKPASRTQEADSDTNDSDEDSDDNNSSSRLRSKTTALEKKPSSALAKVFTVGKFPPPPP